MYLNENYKRVIFDFYIQRTYKNILEKDRSYDYLKIVFSFLSIFLNVYKLSEYFKY